MPSADHTVYLVDPDPVVAETLFALLEVYGIRVRSFANAASFLAEIVADQALGCVLIEANRPEDSGVSLLVELRRMNSELAVIILTDDATPELLDKARQHGAVDMLEKPLATAFLLSRLAMLLPNATTDRPPTHSTFKLVDGTEVTLRVMQPDDAIIVQNFVRGLSARSRYQRFFSNIKELSPNTLEQFTHPQYPDSYALVATLYQDGSEQQIGGARYAPADQSGVVEFAVVVTDEWQGRGIASHLLRALTAAAAVGGKKQLIGMVLGDNEAMLKLARAAGFSVSRIEGEQSMVKIAKRLDLLT